jgi:aminopeptidase-like protein
VDAQELKTILGVPDLGAALHAAVERLYPLCRSITGDGVRQTLALLGEKIPLEIHEVPTGTAVLDWTVPREWNIRDAYVKDASGRRVIDFARSNLHVVGYSVPVPRQTMSLEQLQTRLHSMPEKPDWIPYRNSFYKDDWGFCLPQNERDRLQPGDYEVCIDSTLADGSLTYGELLLPGSEKDEVLICCHVCHPSLCNDNLSGDVVAAFLARILSSRSRRYSYRFLFLPVTIGAITWLSRNEDTVKRIRHGLVLTLLGDAGNFTYKKSRRGDTEIDRTVAQVLRHRAPKHEIQEFFPYGYDERQFCSPGYDMPVGCLMRTPHGCFPEYHTSGDNLSFVKPGQLEDALLTCLEIVETLEGNARYVNQNPKGEPQLGRRGIFRSLAERKDGGLEMALLWVLNLSDGQHSLLDICERAAMPFSKIRAAADVLCHHELLLPA